MARLNILLQIITVVLKVKNDKVSKKSGNKQDYMLDIIPREIVDLMQTENKIDLFKNKEKSLNHEGRRTTRKMTS